MHDTRRRAERWGCQGYAFMLAGLLFAAGLVVWVVEWVLQHLP